MGINISRLTKILTIIVIGWDPSIKNQKGSLFDLHRREEDVERHSLYYTKCHAIFWSIIKYNLNIYIQTYTIKRIAYSWRWNTGHFL